MASLLSDKPREDWSEVHRSIGFSHNEGNTQVESTMKILSFSYYELPPHLRACLLYLSVFPEDHFIEKTPLIWMWIAEGFVHEEQAGKSSFEIGEGYFNKLVNRSMIQLAEEIYGWSDDAMVCGCRVHDMVLDLIHSISSEENFITRLLLDGSNKSGASSSRRLGQSKVRRLALQSDGTAKAHMEDMKQVKSFISRGCGIFDDKRGWSFKFVRVLMIGTSFCRCTARQYLMPIQNLLHLRCLQLSCRYVDLPEKEMATLKFLQTLDVVARLGRVGLLTQLRCLRFREPVTAIPQGIGKLTSLEELEIYNYCIQDIDREAEAASWRGFINELGGLSELKVLRVGMPDSLEHAQVDMVQSLCNLHKLEYLSLSVGDSVCADTETCEAAGGGSLLLPWRLRQLFLLTLVFSRIPSFFINSSRLPNLSHLKLEVEDMDAQQDLRILGELPELHFLELTVRSTVQLVCTGPTEDHACLFRKLRQCNLYCRGGVRLPSTKEGSGGVSIRMRQLEGFMLLGSRRNKDVAPSLLPSVQELQFDMSLREFQDGNGSLSLEYFGSLQSVSITVFCGGAPTAVLVQVEAALRRAADVHPNRPTLELYMRS